MGDDSQIPAEERGSVRAKHGEFKNVLYVPLYGEFKNVLYVQENFLALDLIKALERA